MSKVNRCVAVLGLVLAGCAPAVQQAVQGPLPAERGPQCREACAQLGMTLTSVVLIMNSAGCVCQVIDPKPAPAATQGGAAAAAGGAAIAATAAAAAAQAQSSQRSAQAPAPYKPPPSVHH